MSVKASIDRAKLILDIYRTHNSNNGNSFSHVRDLMIDLLHYIDNTDQGAASYQLLEIVSEIFSEEKVEHFDFHENP